MDIKEIERYKIRNYYMIPVEVIDNIFYLFGQQCNKQKEVIDKAIEYISNKKAIINTDVIRIFDLFEIDEQGYIDKLLDILNEVEK